MRARRSGLPVLGALLGLLVTWGSPVHAQQSSPDSTRADSSRASRAGSSGAPLVTDRPDFTESTASVEPGRVQVEAGYTLSRQDGVDEHAVGEVLARVGVGRRVEIRVAPSSYVLVNGRETSVDGLADPSVGAKATLLEPGPDAPGALPSAAVLASSSLPTGHDALNPNGAEPEAILALDWELGDRVSLGANLKQGLPISGGERYAQTVASTALGLRVHGQLGAYLEYYTLRPSAPEAGAADVANGGLTLLLGPDAQLDARLGAGLGPEAPDLILGVGLALRR